MGKGIARKRRQILTPFSEG
jgi:hypothetical protein